MAQLRLRASTTRQRSVTWFAGLIVCVVVVVRCAPMAQNSIDAQHTEGRVHDLLSLKTLKGTQLADGDWVQSAQGDLVTTRLVFRFEDGSIHDETAVYSQHQPFQLLTNHLIQKGPAFPRAIDMTIDRASSQVTVRYTAGGREKTVTECLALPPDLANGLVTTILKSVRADAPLPTMSFVVATPKPLLVRLVTSVAGVETVSTGGAERKATHFVLTAKAAGVAGVLAPLLGLQPPDSHVWILQGPPPAFVKAEQPLYVGGPLWQIELTSRVGGGAGASTAVTLARGEKKTREPHYRKIGR